MAAISPCDPECKKALGNRGRPCMSNYTDDARETPSDSSVRHDSSRADILDSDVLTASASSTAIDDVRWVGQPRTVQKLERRSRRVGLDVQRL